MIGPCLVMKIGGWHIAFSAEVERRQTPNLATRCAAFSGLIFSTGGPSRATGVPAPRSSRQASGPLGQRGTVSCAQHPFRQMRDDAPLRALVMEAFFRIG
jgi:hypothetical protein